MYGLLEPVNRRVLGDFLVYFYARDLFNHIKDSFYGGPFHGVGWHHSLIFIFVCHPLSVDSILTFTIT